MTKEYEQARDAAMIAFLKTAKRVTFMPNTEPTFVAGATFATDYWAKEIEKRDEAALKNVETARTYLTEAINGLQRNFPMNADADMRNAARHLDIVIAAFREGRK